MPRPLNGLILLLTCGYLAACSTPTTRSRQGTPDLTAEEVRYQQGLQLQRLLDYQTRIERIGAPLLKAALPFCPGRQTGYLGLRVDNLSAWRGPRRRLAREVLKLDEALQVTQVQPGSPAERAGLRPGDMVLRVNGTTTIGGTGAVEDYRQLVRQGAFGPVVFDVLREGQERQLRIEPERVCDYPLYVAMDNSINAFADGAKVQITSGLIRFSENDREIALVLAHEIAHNAMNHLEAKRANSASASVLDLFVAAYGIDSHGLFASLGGRAFSKAFEQEADYVGLYIMARAGLETEGLEQFWRRVAAETPNANEDSMFRSHPISAQRTLAIQQTNAELRDKRAAGAPLLPNPAVTGR